MANNESDNTQLGYIQEERARIPPYNPNAKVEDPPIRPAEKKPAKELFGEDLLD